MDKLERIHNLLDELMDAVTDCFPEATSIHVSNHANGYRNFTVERWEDNNDLPVEAWKRRTLFDQHRIGFDGEWSKDRSDEQNGYYKDRKVLLEDRKGA